MLIHQICRGLSIALALAGTFAARAGQDGAPTNTVQLEAVPPAVRQTLREKAKDATILRLIRTPAVYLVRFDDHGQKSEVRVTEEGKVLRNRSKQEAEAQFEQDKRLRDSDKVIPLQNVTPAARQVIVERSKGLVIEQIVQSPPNYTAQIEVRIEEDGSISRGSGIR